jgi:hypothetical protein
VKKSEEKRGRGQYPLIRDSHLMVRIEFKDGVKNHTLIIENMLIKWLATRLSRYQKDLGGEGRKENKEEGRSEVRWKRLWRRSMGSMFTCVAGD